jgi:integrase
LDDEEEEEAEETIPEDTKKNGSRVDPLTEFFDSIKNEWTKKNYTKRLKLFFDYLKLQGDFKAQAKEFQSRAKQDPQWATLSINEYMRYQKLRAQNGEISESTVPNFYKPIRLFCEENDVLLNWKKISRRIPRGRSAADDRVPTLDEIKKLLQYPDRRVKIAVLLMLSSGCRIGALPALRWGDIESIEKGERLIAAKIKLYAGTSSQYFSFITPECYRAIKEYIEFRKASGEKITRESLIFRDLFPPELGARGEPHQPKKLSYDALRNLIYKAYRRTGLRNEPLPKGKKRHEFSADHAFRKYFTTVSLKHTSSLNVQILRGDDTGLMESYNRPTEEYLLGEYLKCVPELTISDEESRLLAPSPSIEEIDSLKQKVAGLEEVIKQVTNALPEILESVTKLKNKSKSKKKDEDEKKKKVALIPLKSSQEEQKPSWYLSGEC